MTISDTWRVISRAVTGDHELVFVEPTEAKAAKRLAILERQGFVVRIERRAALTLVVDNTRQVRP